MANGSLQIIFTICKLKQNYNKTEQNTLREKFPY